MIVDPNEKLPGSTSVACWLVLLVKASVLSFTRGVVAGGKFGPEPEPLFVGKKELEPEPQLKLAAIAHTAEMYLTTDFTASPLLVACGGRFLKLTGVLSGVNAA